MLLCELKQTNKGTYIALKVSEETQEALTQYIKENKIPNPIPVTKYHVTMIYSLQHVPNVDDLIDNDQKIECKFDSFAIFGENNDSLVLKIKSKELQEKHQYYLTNGATHTFDEFKPHITLSYDIGDDFDYESLPKFSGKIVLCDEYAEPLDTEWKEKLNDDSK